MRKMPQNKLFITGAGGFIGSHLVDVASLHGFDVLCGIHYNGNAYTGNLVRTDVKVSWIDVKTKSTVRDAMCWADCTINLAALISVPYSFEAPQSYIDTNVYGALNLLEICREFNKPMVQISSSEVYGTPEVVPITEKHPIKPQSPYAASKVAADALAMSYYKSYNAPVMVLRPFNTYGPRQSTRAFIPSIISQMLDGGDISCGNLTPTRDFVYVADTCLAMLCAASGMIERRLCGETIHFGTGKEYQMTNIVEMCAKKIGWSGEMKRNKQAERKKSAEVYRLLADPSMAREKLGWIPKVDIEEGLDRTIQHFRSNQKQCRSII